MTQTADLSSLLRGEISAVEDFVAVLRGEQSLLQAGESDPLPALAEQKAALIERLGELAGARNAALAAAGLGIDRDGLAIWARTQGVSATDLVEHLLALAADARELNRLNGQLIALRLNHTQAALSALTAASGDTRLYGPDGQASSRTGYRIIDSA